MLENIVGDCNEVKENCLRIVSLSYPIENSLKVPATSEDYGFQHASAKKQAEMSDLQRHLVLASRMFTPERPAGSLFAPKE